MHASAGAGPVEHCLANIEEAGEVSAVRVAGHGPADYRDELGITAEEVARAITELLGLSSVTAGIKDAAARTLQKLLLEEAVIEDRLGRLYLKTPI